MALILFIDTSTSNCSVALAENKQIVSTKMELHTRSHAKLLPTFIQSIFQEAEIEPKQLDAIVVAVGPGSYTGLRIGMSTAKGMCYTLDLPLIALDSLENLASTMLTQQEDKEAIYLATLDSRKGEIYYAAMDGNGRLICPSRPAKITELDWSKWAKHNVYISGNTSDKISAANLRLELRLIQTQYQAKNYISEGFKRFNEKNFDDLVYTEPKYLKPFL